MAYITAAQIHDGQQWLPPGSIIATDVDGTITGISTEAPKDAQVIVYDGILAPGFVNVHCHLELSHMQGAIPEGTGLIPFLQQVTFHRNDYTDEQKAVAREAAMHAMHQQGIVAVGDIANGIDTLELRSETDIHLHTFVECIGFTETHVQQRIDYAVDIYSQFAMQAQTGKRLRQSIVPHAPYSVSQALFEKIDAFDPESIISIHNQESAAENEYYARKEGYIKGLLAGFGIDDSFFTPSGQTSLQTYLPWFADTHPFVFVHNTFTHATDVRFVQRRLPQACWCLCPNANLYIEQTLPDVVMLQNERAHICIGTDSLASNHQLSILAELHTLKTHLPELDWETLLKWGTYNGACALQMDDIVGSIAVGKKPSIVQLTGLDANGTPQVMRVV